MNDADVRRGSARRYAVMLACAAAAMIILLGLELWHRTGETGPAREPALVAYPEPAQPSAMAAIGSADAKTLAKRLLARPLFSPDRHPPSEPVPVLPSPASPLPRLAGVIVTPAGRRAIFAAPDGKPAALQEGDRLNGFTIQSIHPGQVSLRRTNDVRLVIPTYDRAAPAQPAPIALPGFPLAPQKPG